MNKDIEEIRSQNNIPYKEESKKYLFRFPIGGDEYGTEYRDFEIDENKIWSILNSYHQVGVLKGTSAMYMDTKEDMVIMMSREMLKELKEWESKFKGLKPSTKEIIEENIDLKEKIFNIKQLLTK